MRHLACLFTHDWMDLPSCPKGHLRQACARGCDGAKRWLKDVDPRKGEILWKPGLCDCKEDRAEPVLISGEVINHIANTISQALFREGILVNGQVPPPAVLPALLALACTFGKMRGLEHHHLQENLEVLFYGGRPN